MSFECSLSLTAYLWNSNEIQMLIQPDGLLGGLDKHIEYICSAERPTALLDLYGAAPECSSAMTAT